MKARSCSSRMERRTEERTKTRMETCMEEPQDCVLGIPPTQSGGFSTVSSTAGRQSQIVNHTIRSSDSGSKNWTLSMNTAGAASAPMVNLRWASTREMNFVSPAVR